MNTSTLQLQLSNDNATDASSFEIGLALFEVQDTCNGQQCPVCYASKSQQNSEMLCCHSKKALVVTWACKTFSDYVLSFKNRPCSDSKKKLILRQTTNHLLHSWISQMLPQSCDSAGLPDWEVRLLVGGVKPFHIRKLGSQPQKTKYEKKRGTKDQWKVHPYWVR